MRLGRYSARYEVSVTNDLSKKKIHFPHKIYAFLHFFLATLVKFTYLRSETSIYQPSN